MLSGVSGPELSVWRFLLGGSGLVVIALLFGESRHLLAPLRKHGSKIIFLSLLGVTLAYLAFHWSLDFATVPQVATTVTTIPIFVALASAVVNEQKLSGGRIASGAAATLGVALLITDGYLVQLSGSGQNLIGILLAMFCAAAVGLTAVMLKPMVVEFGALRITALTLLVGAIGLWLLVGVAWKIWVNPFTLFDRPASETGVLVTIAFFNTTITQFLWIGGLAAVPDITRGSYLFFVKPVIAVVLTWLFLQQPITAVQLLAIGVICAAVIIEANWKKMFSTSK